jgi:hypothetical protein
MKVKMKDLYSLYVQARKYVDGHIKNYPDMDEKTKEVILISHLTYLINREEEIEDGNVILP